LVATETTEHPSQFGAGGGLHSTDLSVSFFTNENETSFIEQDVGSALSKEE
tara:strand:- start:613 stop:765 length:153 start_codon:yes stop_codon:yes gene_type:complete